MQKPLGISVRQHVYTFITNVVILTGPVEPLIQPRLSLWKETFHTF